MKILNIIYLVLTSLSIGWLVGMAVSPVVGIVITSFFTIIITVVSLLSGLPSERQEENHLIKSFSNINLLPIAILSVFLVIGASLGIYTRTHDLLESIPKTVGKEPIRDRDLQATGGLYSLSLDDRQLLISKHGLELKTRLQVLAAKDENVKYLINNCNTDSCLEAIKNIICGSAK